VLLIRDSKSYEIIKTEFSDDKYVKQGHYFSLAVSFKTVYDLQSNHEGPPAIVGFRVSMIRSRRVDFVCSF